MMPAGPAVEGLVTPEGRAGGTVPSARRVLRNLPIFAVSDIVARIVTVAMTPILTRLLTPGQYAAPALALAAWDFISAAQFAGMDSAYPFFRAQTSDDEQRRRIVATASIVATLGLLALWVLFTAFGLALPVITEFTGTTRTEFALFALGLVPAALTYWYLYVVRFMHRADVFARITVVARVMTTVLAVPVVALVAPDDRLLALFGAMSLLQIAGTAYAYRELAVIGVRPYARSLWERGLAKRLVRYGSVLVPPALVYGISAVLDRSLVAALSSHEEVALLAIAITLAGIATMLKRWLLLVWEPNVVEWIAAKRPDVYVPRLQVAVSALSVVFALLTALAAIWSEPVLVWVYPPYYTAAAPLIPVILLGLTFSVLGVVGNATALIGQRPGLYAPTFLIALAANFGLAVILIPSEGALGAVLGTALGEAVILGSWIVVGRLILRNLPLRWLAAAPPIAVACAFQLYDAGMLLPDAVALERVLMSAVAVGAAAAYVATRPELVSVLRRLRRSRQP
jgi:O-antigen/teichoic acid export membrane protein